MLDVNIFFICQIILVLYLILIQDDFLLKAMGVFISFQLGKVLLSKELFLNSINNKIIENKILIFSICIEVLIVFFILVIFLRAQQKKITK